MTPPPQTPDPYSEYELTGEIYSRRKASLNSRLVVGIITAGLHALLASPVQAAVWITLIIVTQCIEIYYGERLLKRDRAQSAFTLSVYRLTSFSASLFYATIAPIIWFSWDVIGPLFAIIALCGAIVHAALTQSESPRLLLYTMTPHAFWLLVLPAAYLYSLNVNAFAAYGAMLFVAAIFIRHAIHASSTFRDTLNRLRQIGEREREQRDAAQKLADKKSQLVLDISHEIRTPLNGVIGMLQILKQHGSLDAQAKDELQTCWQSAMALQQIANEKLDLTAHYDQPDDAASPKAKLSREEISAGVLHRIEAGDPDAPQNMRALVVDDNTTNRRVATKMLEKLGYEAETCSDGDEAVNICAAKKFGIILMDLQMPNMDGDIATKHIRALPSYHKTPIIAVSANCNAEHQQRFRDAKMNAFLEKPFTLKQLQALINNTAAPTDKKVEDKGQPDREEFASAPARRPARAL